MEGRARERACRRGQKRKQGSPVWKGVSMKGMGACEKEERKRGGCRQEEGRSWKKLASHTGSVDLEASTPHPHWRRSNGNKVIFGEAGGVDLLAIEGAEDTSIKILEENQDKGWIDQGVDR
ncbi:hypothetical protein L1987_24592 [Smallanthus sonchifolius]|uniref:Uncharacterized protein n=1 Tax=Smallanthus sonchifolius TaxID=185202 RepID=A0ACB9IKW1_9ASTR|nr:hypothetical protein L1987_24592 [Smallanthus sonchifolius]